MKAASASPTVCRGTAIAKRDRFNDDSLESISPVRYEASATLVPAAMLRALRSSGASISRGCGITHVVLETVTAVSTYAAWISSLPEDSDPLLRPAESHNAAVNFEVRQILQQVAVFRAAEFVAGTALLVAPAVAAPPLAVRFSHSTMALNAVPNFLAHADLPHFPAIAALPRGTVICYVVATWAKGVVIDMPVVKA